MRNMRLILRNMTATKPARSHGTAEAFFRYLPVNEGLREWGMYVASEGYSQRPSERRLGQPVRSGLPRHFGVRRLDAAVRIAFTFSVSAALPGQPACQSKA